MCGRQCRLPRTDRQPCMLKEGELLSQYAAGFQAEARRKYCAFFKLFEGLTNHSNSLLQRFHLEADDAQGILVASYFSRTIDSVNASVILAAHSLSVQSRVVLRTALESQFNLRACLSAEFCEKLIAADLVQRKKMLRKAESLAAISDIPSLKKMLSSDEIATFRKRVSDIEAGNMPIAEIAKAAGCYDLYLGIYTTLSAAVHSSLYDIERRLVISENGRIEALSAGPDLSDVSFLLVGAIEVLLDASMAAGAFVAEDHLGYWEHVHKSLRTLADAELAKT
jgi:hypothetical protein